MVYHKLSHAIRARYIRFRPVAWHGHISMRVEIYGCKGKICIFIPVIKTLTNCCLRKGVVLLYKVLYGEANTFTLQDTIFGRKGTLFEYLTQGY